MIDANKTIVFQFLQGGLAAHFLVTVLQSLMNPERYTAGGIHSFSLSRYIYREDWQKRLYDLLFRPPRFRYILYASVGFSIIVGAQAILADFSLWSLSILFCLIILYKLRHHTGLNGSDDLAFVTGAGLLWGLTTSSDIAATLAIGFIAVQSVLSYSISGWFKLLNQDWRDGSFLIGLSNAELWVSDSAANFLSKHPKSAKPLAWAVISLESLFFLTLFAPKGIMIGLMIFGLCMHLLNAYVIGLNRFLIMFPMTYPAIYHINQVLRTAANAPLL